MTAYKNTLAHFNHACVYARDELDDTVEALTIIEEKCRAWLESNSGTPNGSHYKRVVEATAPNRAVVAERVGIVSRGVPQEVNALAATIELGGNSNNYALIGAVVAIAVVCMFAWYV